MKILLYVPFLNNNVHAVIIIWIVTLDFSLAKLSAIAQFSCKVCTCTCICTVAVSLRRNDLARAALSWR